MPQRVIENVISAAKVAVEVRTFSLDDHAEVETLFEDSCFIAFALWPRPGMSRGRFKDIWVPARSELIGDIVFVPNGLTMVGTGVAGPRRYFACNLDADLFTLNWEQLSERAFVESLNLESAPVRGGLRRLLKEATEPSLHSPLALEATATLLAIDIQRRLEGLQDTPSRKKGGLSPARLRKIEERVRSERPIPSLAELAAHCDLSTRHLARAFREETGKAIGEYVNAASRERACSLLTGTDLPVRVIAERVGFSSPASFSYAFRRAMGVRPSDMRKTARTVTKRRAH